MGKRTRLGGDLSLFSIVFLSGEKRFFLLFFLPPFQGRPLQPPLKAHAYNDRPAALAATRAATHAVPRGTVARQRLQYLQRIVTHDLGLLG